MFTLSLLSNNIIYKDFDGNTILDPKKVPTSEINCYKQDVFRMRGWIMGGEWDREIQELQNHPLYEILKLRFVDGKSWVNAGYYNFAKQQIDDGGNAWGITKPEHITLRTQELDQLWTNLNNDYKTKKEILRESTGRPYQNTVDAIHPLMDEIGVDVGRDGTLIFNRCGTHRLIIAKLANLDHVYVQYYRIHAEYFGKITNH
jgi:hypothetical protein